MEIVYWSGMKIHKYVCPHLPKKEETECDLNGCQPHSIEIHHKIHQLLGIGRDQIDYLPHCACSACCAIHDKRLGINKMQQQKQRERLIKNM